MDKIILTKEDLFVVEVRQYEGKDSTYLYEKELPYKYRVVFLYEDDIVDAITGDILPLVDFEDDLIASDIYENTLYAYAIVNQDISDQISDNDLLIAQNALDKYLNIKELKKEKKLIEFPRIKLH